MDVLLDMFFRMQMINILKDINCFMVNLREISLLTLILGNLNETRLEFLQIHDIKTQLQIDIQNLCEVEQKAEISMCIMLMMHTQIGITLIFACQNQLSQTLLVEMQMPQNERR